MKVVRYRNLPAKLPTVSTLLTYLLLDKWQAPEFVWGLTIGLFGLYWIAVIYNLITQEQIDLFEEQKNKKP